MAQCNNRLFRLSGPLLIILLCGGIMGMAGRAEATLTITSPSNNSTFPPETSITFTASCVMCYAYTWEFWNIADPTIADGGSGYTLQKTFTIPGQYKAKVTAINEIYDPYIGYYPVTVVKSVTFMIRSDEYTITITPHEGGAVSGPSGKDDGITACRPSDAGTSRCVETYGKLTDKLQGSQFQIELDEGWQLLGWNVNGTFYTKLVLKKHEDLTLEPFFGQVEFIDLWDTKNPANTIYNSTRKDDPPALPKNALYLAEDGSGEYHITLSVENGATALQDHLMYGVYTIRQGTLPLSSGNIPATGIATITFQIPDASSLSDFQVRVGYDLNENGELDWPEVLKLSVKDENGLVLGEPVVRGTNARFYHASTLAINGVIGRTTLLPHTSQLVKLFRDGEPDTLIEGKQPSDTSAITFDAFGSPGNFSEWLTHNAGAPFDENGIAELKFYTYDDESSLAVMMASSFQLVDASETYYEKTIKPIVEAYFADKPTGTSQKFPESISPPYSLPLTHESSWVPPYTVGFDTPGITNLVNDDRLVGIGRGRVIDPQVRYTVEKIQILPSGETELVVTAAQYTGVIEDLYDYNRETAEMIGPLVFANMAAVVQLGYGNGASGRTVGKIYRLRIEYDSVVPLPFNLY